MLIGLSIIGGILSWFAGMGMTAILVNEENNQDVDVFVVLLIFWPFISSYHFGKVLTKRIIAIQFEQIKASLVSDIISFIILIIGIILCKVILLM